MPEINRDTQPTGEIEVRKINAADYDQHVERVLAALDLAPGWRTWLTIRVDLVDGTPEVRATTHAMTSNGDVSVQERILVTPLLADALADALTASRDDLGDQLKRAVARTLVDTMGLGQLVEPEQEGN